MKILEVNIEEIQPYMNNPRINDGAVNAVTASIKQFGWKQPIVIDKDGVIVAGHTRYKAAQKLEMATIPCVIADDLTEEEIRAYRLADNKTVELSEWDFAVLDEELSGIINIDMSIMGFENPTIDFVDEIAAFQKIDEKKALEHKCPVCGYEW